MRRSLGTATLALLLLSGCTSVTTPDVTPAPAATETLEPQGDPQPTLPLTCADLLTEAEASGVLQYDVTLKVDEAAIYRPWQIGAHQAGLLSCAWGAENKTDNSWDQSVQLDILPNAEDDWQVGVWQVDDGAIVYPDGSTTSEYLCSPVEQTSRCTANLLVDGYWAQVRTQSIGTADGRSDDSAAASMRTVLDLLAPRIAAAGDARPQWVEPAGVLEGKYCEGSSSTPQPSFVDSVATARAGWVSCSQGSDWGISIQPGGAWAVPQLIGSDLAYALQNAQPTNAVGADSGVWACGDGCGAVYAVDGSAVALYGPVMDEDAFSAKAAELLAAVVAAG